MKKTRKETFDDVVFERKPKEYGAFYLRWADERFLTRSLILSAAAFLLAFLLPFLFMKNSRSAPKNELIVSVETGLKKMKNEVILPPPPPPPIKDIERRVVFRPPVVVNTNETEDNFGNQDDLNSKPANNNIPNDSNVVISDDVPLKPPAIDPVEVTLLPAEVQELPVFPGGDEERIKYLSNNIKYPQIAKETGIHGTVYIEFVVDNKGVVKDIKLLRGIGGGCDEEALRVVKNMPVWTPGKQSGNPVKVKLTLPIIFTLRE